MARELYQPLSRDVHRRALADAERDGRKVTAARYGIGVATLERALAFASLSPLARRAIERGAGAASANNDTAAQAAG